MDNNQTTHFGFRTVDQREKQGLVAGVFHSVAGKYDLMNDLMSLGVHRLWKFLTTENSGLQRGDVVLDIAGGTGDLTAAFAKQVGQQGHVYLADINDSMLHVGRDRLIDRGIVGNVSLIQANAEALPLPNESMNLVSIAFGLRNVTRKEVALADMYRVLKPGSKLMVLEFSKPIVPGLNALYDQYSFKVLPKLGRLITGDADSYQYLAESIRMHPDQDTLKTMIEDAGFERCEYFNLSGGIVALHVGYKA